ncbi:MAG: hypothetical protein EXS36_07765 [Pedosphaera sp.]|nr:hypothetical protein [Pedosphaera sp.]
MSLPDLPHLFIADLGSGLTLGPETLRDACFALRQNREHWLAGQRTRPLLEIVAYTAEQWLDPNNEYRIRALRDGPAETGFPAATLARGLDAFFGSLTFENLEALVVQDLGDSRRLDEFSSTVPEARGARTALARGPILLAHIAAGNLPNPTLFSMVLGILLKSAQLVKCPLQGGLLPSLFAHSLAHTEPKLGSCLELARWPGGDERLEAILFHEADCVTATGNDETLAHIRRRVPLRTRFVSYGHRLSFAYVSNELLSTYSVKRVVRNAGADITAWNQLGCLSPHVFYIQEDGAISPEGFAELLAAELEAREATEPRGDLSPDESAAISTRRAIYEMRAAAGVGVRERFRAESPFLEAPGRVRLWKSENSTAWTVVLETDLLFQASCLNRFIYVKPVRKLTDALRYLEPHRHQVSTFGLGAVDFRAVELSRELARWGVPRICPLGKMQEPPAPWRHDGRPSLGDLVTWTDFET